MLEHLIPTRRAFTGDDPIFMANAEAVRRKQAGEDVLNATIGALLDDTGHLVIHDSILRLWRELEPLEIAPYTPIAGDPAYLKALTQRHWPTLSSHGAGCATPGGSGALMLSIRNFLEPGQTLLTAAPFWGPYRTISSENQVHIATAPFPQAGESLDVEAWEAAARTLLENQGRLLLWLNDPCHNPTGHSLTREDRQALMDLPLRLTPFGPITLLLDCAYLDYTADPGHVREALDHYAHFASQGKVLVGASLSLSKSFTLYGGRAGALVFPWCPASELQAALAQSCRGNYSNCARAPHSVLLRLMKDGKAQEALAAEHRHWSEVLTARAKALDEALRAEGLPGAPWKGGFFVTLRVADPGTVNARLKERGVFVVPLPEGLRVGLCGIRIQDATRLASALKEALA